MATALQIALLNAFKRHQTNADVTQPVLTIPSVPPTPPEAPLDPPAVDPTPPAEDPFGTP